MSPRLEASPRSGKVPLTFREKVWHNSQDLYGVGCYFSKAFALWMWITRKTCISKVLGDRKGKKKKKILWGKWVWFLFALNRWVTPRKNKPERLCFINNKSSWLVQQMPVFFCLLNPLPYKSEGFLICLGLLARNGQKSLSLSSRGSGFRPLRLGLAAESAHAPRPPGRRPLRHPPRQSHCPPSLPAGERVECQREGSLQRWCHISRDPTLRFH